METYKATLTTPIGNRYDVIVKKDPLGSECNVYILDWESYPSTLRTDISIRYMYDMFEEQNMKWARNSHTQAGRYWITDLPSRGVLTRKEAPVVEPEPEKPVDQDKLKDQGLDVMWKLLRDGYSLSKLSTTSSETEATVTFHYRKEA